MLIARGNRRIFLTWAFRDIFELFKLLHALAELLLFFVVESFHGGLVQLAVSCKKGQEALEEGIL
jgi:hypothetical protein